MSLASLISSRFLVFGMISLGVFSSGLSFAQDCFDGCNYAIEVIDDEDCIEGPVVEQDISGDGSVDTPWILKRSDGDYEYIETSYQGIYKNKKANGALFREYFNVLEEVTNIWNHDKCKYVPQSMFGMKEKVRSLTGDPMLFFSTNRFAIFTKDPNEDGEFGAAQYLTNEKRSRYTIFDTLGNVTKYEDISSREESGIEIRDGIKWLLVTTVNRKGRVINCVKGSIWTSGKEEEFDTCPPLPRIFPELPPMA